MCLSLTSKYSIYSCRTFMFITIIQYDSYTCQIHIQYARRYIVSSLSTSVAAFTVASLTLNAKMFLPRWYSRTNSSCHPSLAPTLRFCLQLIDEFTSTQEVYFLIVRFKQCINWISLLVLLIKSLALKSEIQLYEFPVPQPVNFPHFSGPKMLTLTLNLNSGNEILLHTT